MDAEKQCILVDKKKLIIITIYKQAGILCRL